MHGKIPKEFINSTLNQSNQPQPNNKQHTEIMIIILMAMLNHFFNHWFWIWLELTNKKKQEQFWFFKLKDAFVWLCFQVIFHFKSQISDFFFAQSFSWFKFYLLKSFLEEFFELNLFTKDISKKDFTLSLLYIYFFKNIKVARLKKSNQRYIVNAKCIFYDY